MTDKFRSKSFHMKGRGTYILIYQRPNEDPIMDFNFLDGDRDIEFALELEKITKETTNLAIRWRNGLE